MWHRESDLTMSAEIAELSRNPVHPVTGAPIVLDTFLKQLKAEIDFDGIAYWYGTLEDGTRVLVWND